MGKLVLSINLSIDGFADHTVAIGADDELHDFYGDLQDETEVAIFGRVTYELMEAYWPHAHEDPGATEGMLRFADKFNAVPKIVFSRSLANAGWHNTTLARDDLIDAVAKLKRRTDGNISIGGIRVAQALMRSRMIDEYWFAIHPIVTGTGRRLFDGIDQSINLTLAGTRTFRSGAVVLHYVTAE